MQTLEHTEVSTLLEVVLLVVEHLEDCERAPSESGALPDLAGLDDTVSVGDGRGVVRDESLANLYADRACNGLQESDDPTSRSVSVQRLERRPSRRELENLVILLNAGNDVGLRGGKPELVDEDAAALEGELVDALRRNPVRRLSQVGILESVGGDVARAEEASSGEGVEEGVEDGELALKSVVGDGATCLVVLQLSVRDLVHASKVSCCEAAESTKRRKKQAPFGLTIDTHLEATSELLLICLLIILLFIIIIPLPLEEPLSGQNELSGVVENVELLLQRGKMRSCFALLGRPLGGEDALLDFGVEDH